MILFILLTADSSDTYAEELNTPGQNRSGPRTSATRTVPWDDSKRPRLRRGGVKVLGAFFQRRGSGSFARVVNPPFPFFCGLDAFVAVVTSERYEFATEGFATRCAKTNRPRESHSCASGKNQ